MPWLVISDRNTVNVIPEADRREHLESPTCWCLPKVEHYAVALIVHHSLDGREYSEPDMRPEYQEAVN